MSLKLNNIFLTQFLKKQSSNFEVQKVKILIWKKIKFNKGSSTVLTFHFKISEEVKSLPSREKHNYLRPI